MFEREIKKEKDTRQLPPGQKVIDKALRWGIDHTAIVKDIPKLDLMEWRLIVDGEVETSLRLDWKDLLELPRVVSVSDFHCVEGWSVLDRRWEGVLFKTLVSMVKPRAGVVSVFFECADGYSTSISLEDLLDDDVVLAYRLNGEALESSFGGPLRLVIPEKYGYKSAMWLTGIRFMKTRRLGYWEQRGYSDTADVWKNDRFSG
jgi:DMSO/TMAO reductase YedYZ molybdopterin-dependent catalytic subunit